MATVTQVDFIVNPQLTTRFEAKKEQFLLAGKSAKPVLMFHRRTKQLADDILRNNFRLGATNTTIHFDQDPDKKENSYEASQHIDDNNNHNNHNRKRKKHKSAANNNNGHNSQHAHGRQEFEPVARECFVGYGSNCCAEGEGVLCFSESRNPAIEYHRSIKQAGSRSQWPERQVLLSLVLVGLQVTEEEARELEQRRQEKASEEIEEETERGKKPGDKGRRGRGRGTKKRANVKEEQGKEREGEGQTERDGGEDGRQREYDSVLCGASKDEVMVFDADQVSDFIS